MSDLKAKTTWAMATGGMLAYALSVIAMAAVAWIDLAFVVPASFFLGGAFAGLCVLFISLPEEWMVGVLVSGIGAMTFSGLAFSAIFA